MLKPLSSFPRLVVFAFPTVTTFAVGGLRNPTREIHGRFARQAKKLYAWTALCARRQRQWQDRPGHQPAGDAIGLTDPKSLASKSDQISSTPFARAKTRCPLKTPPRQER